MDRGRWLDGARMAPHGVVSFGGMLNVLTMLIQRRIGMLIGR